MELLERAGTDSVVVQQRAEERRELSEIRVANAERNGLGAFGERVIGKAFSGIVWLMNTVSSSPSTEGAIEDRNIKTDQGEGHSNDR